MSSPRTIQDNSLILEIAIPPGLSKAVAFDCGVCERLVQRWRTGQDASPLDRFLRLFRGVFLNNPDGAAMLFGYIEQIYSELRATHRTKAPQPSKRIAAAQVLKEAAEAVNALNLEVPDSDTLRELFELKLVTEKAIDLVMKSLPKKSEE